jgi:hypothetical protein
MEIKEIPGYPGYSVSEDGRVRGPSGKWLKPKEGPYGHQSVWIAGKWPSVHRLVLLAFVGPCPEGHEAAHENGNARDNRPANLVWKTHAANIQDRGRHGKTALGTRHGCAKLTEDDVRAIRAAYVGRGVGPNAARGGPSQRALGEQYGVTEDTIRAIVRGRLWKHLLPTSASVT